MNNQFPTNTDETNPLLAVWAGPYGGIPPFDKVQIAHFKPALEAAMTENLAEIDKIAANSAAPTFENTITEMERAGSTLERVSTVYYIWNGNMSTPEMREIEREMGPRLAAFNDKITQNAALFQRIDLLSIRAGERYRDFARQKKIAGVASADFNLIAFAAEAFDGFDEENFTCGHDRVG